MNQRPIQWKRLWPVPALLAVIGWEFYTANANNTAVNWWFVGIGAAALALVLFVRLLWRI